MFSSWLHCWLDMKRYTRSTSLLSMWCKCLKFCVINMDAPSPLYIYLAHIFIRIHSFTFFCGHTGISQYIHLYWKCESTPPTRIVWLWNRSQMSRKCESVRHSRVRSVIRVLRLLCLFRIEEPNFEIIPRTVHTHGEQSKNSHIKTIALNRL
jgi:hypothetical protein